MLARRKVLQMIAHVASVGQARQTQQVAFGFQERDRCELDGMLLLLTMMIMLHKLDVYHRKLALNALQLANDINFGL